MTKRKSTRLLLVDKDRVYRRSMKGLLELQGYLVEDASTLREAREKLGRKIDLALIDISMRDEYDPEDTSGLEIARLAFDLGIPCIILTALSSVKMARLALRSRDEKALARDLISKSGGPIALLNSIRLVLGRRENVSNEVKRGMLSIDTAKKLVSKQGKVMNIPTRQYVLLEELFKKEGGIATHAELIKAIYNDDMPEREAKYDRRLRKLVDRTKSRIDSPDSDLEFIEVVSGRGYRLTRAPAGASPNSSRPSTGRSDTTKSSRPPGKFSNKPGSTLVSGEDVVKVISDPREDAVHFTAVYPKEGQVNTWHTLLVYAHIEKALRKVRADAKRFSDEILAPKETSAPARTRLKRGTAITIVPACDGVTFNPERASVKWLEDAHRADFRFRADPSLKEDAAKGQITFYVGPLIVGTLKFAMLFGDAKESPPSKQEEHATMYDRRKIFISYSHKDTQVVLTFKKYHEVIGDDVLIDMDDLRSGEKWNPALLRMIDAADIFQLFWSKNSKASKFCKQEWQHALSRNQEGFIRPVYWKKPFPKPPRELSKLHFEGVDLS